jgi:thiol:disulfide interchange protein
VGFSPCVYPFIPVTLSFIGIKAGASRLKGFRLSIVYVLGMAITYSVLGLIAALTGKLFGQIAANPISSLIVGNACIIAGLSCFDIINIKAGVYLQHKVKRKGDYISVFLFGLVTGLIAGPCTAPVLGAVLLYVASKQNIFYGASLLFVFAYGMGFVLIIAGTFGSLVLHMTKSEVWMMRIRKISGFILIVIGEYFIIQAGRLM